MAQPDVLLSGQLRKAVHPHRFMIWLSMGSIVMMFAGFTSAYIVKQADTNVWNSVELPSLFQVSTVLIVLSSLALILAARAFNRNHVSRYRMALLTTALLGAGFLISQYGAWMQLREGMGLSIGKEVAADFLYVISGAHFLHVLGGVIALFALYANSWRRYRQPEDALMLNLDPGKIPGVELVATYWHFIGLLWLYLIIFFNAYT